MFPEPPDPFWAPAAIVLGIFAVLVVLVILL